MTLFGLYIFLASLVFCGLAVDVGFAYKTRTELQVAANERARLGNTRTGRFRRANG